MHFWQFSATGTNTTVQLRCHQELGLFSISQKLFGLFLNIIAWWFYGDIIIQFTSSTPQHYANTHSLQNSRQHFKSHHFTVNVRSSPWRRYFIPKCHGFSISSASFSKKRYLLDFHFQMVDEAWCHIRLSDISALAPRHARLPPKFIEWHLLCLRRLNLGE